MSASNVSPLKSPVNSTLDDVRAWGSAMAKRGILNETSARLRITGMNQLESVLGDEEPREAQWFLTNIKQIAHRYTIKNSANPDTAATYESRTRSLISDYLKYLQDPGGFAPRGNAIRARKEREKDRDDGTKKSKTMELDLEATESSVPQVPTQPTVLMPAAPSTQAGAPKLHECPLGKDREPFRYVMPGEGLTMADVHRIAIHLAAGTHDFDPTFVSRLRSGASEVAR